MVVSEIGTQNSFQMPRVEDDEMVQAVPADRADQAFDVGILPGTPGDGEHFFHLEGGDPQTNFLAVDVVSISEEILGRILMGEGLDDLMGRPGRTRMLHHIESSTSRRRCSNTRNTNKTFIVIVGTVKKSMETI